MNDLTKEELIKLQDCVSYQRNTQPFGALELDGLCEKIQSMIDDYCDHEYKKTLSKSGMYFIDMCHKCNDTRPYGVLNDNK